jgi:V8-like Glu-specific endopeptidase
VFAAANDPTPLAIIRPDRHSVYVAAGDFTGSGIRQRFGFAGRPAVTGDAPVAEGPLRWAGDLPEPGATPVPDPDLRPHPRLSDPHPSDSRVSQRGTGPSAEGFRQMSQSDGFMHRNAPYRQPMPMPVPPSHMGGGNSSGQVADYDDGYDTPAPPAYAAPGYGSQPQLVGPGPGQGPMPGQWQGQGGPGQGGLGQPQNGTPVPQTAVGQSWSQPLEYVLPEFTSYRPLDVIRTLAGAWTRYQSFSAGVSNTRQFPFSSIVCLRVRRRRKSDGAEVGGIGTAFYIGPNLLLTNAHNFAASRRYHAAHSATILAGLNSTRGAGVLPSNTDAVCVETIDPATAVTIHPLYTSANSGTSRAHDLAVVRVRNAAPHGLHFRIADFSPAPDSRIAVCGYASGSHAQGNDTFDFQDLLPEARADYKQHMDADVIREVVNDGEGILYNLQTLGGNSGSPVFLAPQSVEGDDPTRLMQVIGVHSSGESTWRNHGVLLTPNKRDWALSGGRTAVQQSWQGADAGYGYGQAYYGEPMVAPPTWAPIVAGLVGTATAAGIAGLQASSGDLTWSLQKMEGWLPATGQATPTITVNRTRLQTRTNIEISSPVYQGSVQGNMYAHFYLNFSYDGTGVGGILIEPAPYDSHDNLTGGMRIDMQIVPHAATVPSQIRTGVQVACVEVKMMYTFEWTVEDNDQVTVIYLFYGDGTYESSVRGGGSVLSSTDTTYTQHPRAR